MSLFSLADTFFALRFLRLLTTKWEKTGAFKAGIIDKDGKVLRKAEGPEDKKVYNLFHKLVFNVKRIINKIPFGKSTIASYAAALYLIKEHTNMSDALFGELLGETLGYNPNDDKHDLNESWLLKEDMTLAEGTYVFCEENLVFKTGEVIAGKDRQIIVTEYNCKPTGEIFGIPIFKLMDVNSSQQVIVTNQSLNIH